MTTDEPYVHPNYTVEMEEPTDDAPCRCQNCGWKGTYADALPVTDCALLPGDPSPVGRCPDEECCEALVYLTDPATAFDHPKS
jgi:hypothetical protein